MRRISGTGAVSVSGVGVGPRLGVSGLQGWWSLTPEAALGWCSLERGGLRLHQGFLWKAHWEDVQSGVPPPAPLIYGPGSIRQRGLQAAVPGSGSPGAADACGSGHSRCRTTRVKV